MRRLLLLIAGTGFFQTSALTGAPTDENVLRIESEEQIKAMPRCRATVGSIAPCAVQLTTSDGKQIYLGSPAAPASVIHFIQSLKKGKAYNFPSAFRNTRGRRKKRIATLQQHSKRQKELRGIKKSERE